MSATTPALAPERAHQLHDNVVAAQSLLSPADWAVYLALAQVLPALLRENGLAQTLAFVRQQADAKAGARALWVDWLSAADASPSLPALVLDPAAPKAGGAAQRHHPLYGAASRLAAAEAQRLRRSAEAVQAAGNGLAAPAGHRPDGRRDHLQERADQIGRVLDAAPETPDRWQAASATSTTTAQRQHAGLVWRFGGLPERPVSAAQRATARTRHTNDVAEVASNACVGDGATLYRTAFSRWKRWVEGQASTRTVQVAGRLHLALGSPTVHETQVLLHPVHGMPYLPGSTLKGALRALLERRLADVQPGDAAQAKRLRTLVDPLLGTIRDTWGGQGGAAGLLDAWWVPDNQGPLVREVETPHHSRYHSGRSEVASAFDNPVPVAQLALRGSFLLAIPYAGLGQAWADLVLGWLVDALSDPLNGGLGGKAFAAGYGQLMPSPAG